VCGCHNRDISRRRAVARQFDSPSDERRRVVREVAGQAEGEVVDAGFVERAFEHLGTRVDADVENVHAEERLVEILGVAMKLAGGGEAVDPAVLNLDAPDAQRSQGEHKDQRHDHAARPSGDGQAHLLKPGWTARNSVVRRAGLLKPARMQEDHRCGCPGQCPREADDRAEGREEPERADRLQRRQNKREEGDRRGDGGENNGSAHLAHCGGHRTLGALARRPHWSGLIPERGLREFSSVAIEQMNFIGHTDGDENHGNDCGREINRGVDPTHHAECDDQAGDGLQPGECDGREAAKRDEEDKCHHRDGDRQQTDVMRDPEPQRLQIAR
jgi:hypothetical protein